MEKPSPETEDQKKKRLEDADSFMAIAGVLTEGVDGKTVTEKDFNTGMVDNYAGLVGGGKKDADKGGEDEDVGSEEK